MKISLFLILMYIVCFIIELSLRMVKKAAYIQYMFVDYPFLLYYYHLIKRKAKLFACENLKSLYFKLKVYR
jgi:hypothetical protein